MPKPPTHYLVQGTSAAEVEQLTGLRGVDTPLGVLVERPKPFRIEDAMAEVNRAINPTPCKCGRFALLHQPNCPLSAYANVT